MLCARYGVLAFNDERPSIDQTQRDSRGLPTLRVTAYAQFGRLSRHDGPAFRFLDVEYGCEIYAVDGNVSRVKCICFADRVKKLYDVHMKLMTVTTIESDISRATPVTDDVFDYEKFAQHALRTVNTNISHQNIDLITHHAAMLTRVPIKHKHLSKIYNLMRLGS